MEPVNPFLNAALQYAARGWNIVRCYPGRKQHMGYYFDHTTDPEKLEGWWRETPNANLHVATGRVSGMVCVDIDGVDGMKYWQDHMGGFQYQACIMTPRGLHLLYACEQGDIALPVPTFNLHPQIDVLGDDGQTAMPPSIHYPTGLPYRWASVWGASNPLPPPTPQLIDEIARLRTLSRAPLTTPAA